jgi:PPOX class probable F420-dependent enzyme
MTNDLQVTNGRTEGSHGLAGKIMRWTQAAFNRMRSRAAFAVQSGAATGSFGELADHTYCLVVSYRRDGSAVPTPVWFATGPDRVYFRSLVDNGKTKRMRNDPRVLIAPCDMRGRPLAAAVRGRARFLAPAEEADVERLLHTKYGLGRRAYNKIAATKVPGVYVEVAPD